MSEDESTLAQRREPSDRRSAARRRASPSIVASFAWTPVVLGYCLIDSPPTWMWVAFGVLCVAVLVTQVLALFGIGPLRDKGET